MGGEKILGCMGTCTYNWDGSAWVLASTNCVGGSNCRCAPPPGSPGGPHGTALVPCILHMGAQKKLKGSAKRVHVICVHPDVELRVVHMRSAPAKKRKRRGR